MNSNLRKVCAFIMLIVLASCSGNSPKSVTENFLKAINKMDFDGAKKYGGPFFIFQ